MIAYRCLTCGAIRESEQPHHDLRNAEDENFPCSAEKGWEAVEETVCACGMTWTEWAGPTTYGVGKGTWEGKKGHKYPEDCIRNLAAQSAGLEKKRVTGDAILLRGIDKVNEDLASLRERVEKLEAKMANLWILDSEGEYLGRKAIEFNDRLNALESPPPPPARRMKGNPNYGAGYHTLEHDYLLPCDDGFRCVPVEPAPEPRESGKPRADSPAKKAWKVHGRDRIVSCDLDKACSIQPHHRVVNAEWAEREIEERQWKIYDRDKEIEFKQEQINNQVQEIVRLKDARTVLEREIERLKVAADEDSKFFVKELRAVQAAAALDRDLVKKWAAYYEKREEAYEIDRKKLEGVEALIAESDAYKEKHLGYQFILTEALKRALAGGEKEP